MNLIDNPELSFALHAVRQASQLVSLVQAELVTPAMTKDDRSPVTVADFASQALVASLLSQAFPRDALVAEESAHFLRSPAGAAQLAQVTKYVGRYAAVAAPQQVCDWIDRGAGLAQSRFWVLDPIDGTKGFLRGDQFAVALALVEAGRVKLGVLGCPQLRDGLHPEIGGEGSLVFAARGEGTWVLPLAVNASPTRLKVSDRKDPAQARLLRSFEAGHTNVDQVDELSRLLGSQAAPVRMDSQAKYAVLAAGGGELIVRLLSPSKPDYKEKIWDQAAGAIVLEEAGGKISDLHGRPLDFSAGRSLVNNRGVLASNGALHDLALDALQRIAA